MKATINGIEREWVDCDQCNATGKVTVDGLDPSSLHGHTEDELPCEKCEGTGDYEVTD